MTPHVPTRLSATLLMSAALLAACQTTQQAPVSRSRPAPAPTPAPVSANAGAQETFNSPDEALKGLTDAVKKQDPAALRQIFGPEMDMIASKDPVEQKAALQRFADRLSEKSHVENAPAGSSANLYIGANEYPFPIPLARDAGGKWFFDTRAGETEILNRRIGNDELDTIDALRAFAQAQRDYAASDQDNNGITEYARRFLSSPGHHDGLYWPAGPFEAQSPLGPLAAQASADGYHVTGDASSSAASGPHPFHGYYFKILTRQGPAAPGGAYSYLINGHMVGGFAFLAYPAEYSKSGVMTFILNQNNTLYQQDLGPNTAAKAQAITTFNPDKGWTPVKETAEAPATQP